MPCGSGCAMWRMRPLGFRLDRMTNRATSVVRQAAIATRHFVAARGVEILVLQGSPLFGCLLGGVRPERGAAVRMAWLLGGSLALTAHVFALNDWAGHGDDLRDPRRGAQVFSRQGVHARVVTRATCALLLIALAALALAGGPAVLLGSAIAALSLVYSCSPQFGKRALVWASLHHLLGGALHFLLGYSAFHAMDRTGLELGLFFGLVFAGGHLNQEVRDYEGDSLNGIQTSAVLLGRRPAFLASVLVFTAAYAVLAQVAAARAWPVLLAGSGLAWLLHLSLSLRALQRGLGYATACWMQRRYRLLFALVGLALLISAA